MELFIFYIGACIGSFCHVIAGRFIKKESFICSRSHCESCLHPLFLWEVLPIFSWLFLKGRCRYCKKKISYSYFFIEILFGITFLCIFYTSSHYLDFIFKIILCSILYIISWIDHLVMFIYDIFLYVLAFVTYLYCIFLKLPLFYCLSGAGFISLPLFLISKILPGSIGEGDILLYWILGSVLGIKGSYIAFSISTYLGCIYGLFLVFIKKKSKREHIPFAPFIAIGFVLSFIFLG